MMVNDFFLFIMLGGDAFLQSVVYLRYIFYFILDTLLSEKVLFAHL